MLYEYRGKIFIKVANKYVEVRIEKNGSEYNVIPTKNKEYVEKMKVVKPISLEEAYKKKSRMAKEELE